MSNMNPIYKLRKKEKKKNKCKQKCIEHVWVDALEMNTARNRLTNKLAVYGKKRVQFCKICGALRKREPEGWIMWND